MAEPTVTDTIDEASDDVAEAKLKRRRPAVLHTKADVRREQQRCESTLLTINTRLATVGQRLSDHQPEVELRAMIFAMCRLAVLKGLVTEEELETERLHNVGDQLADKLLLVEQQLLNGGQPERSPQQKRSDLAVVQTPGIIVPKH